MKVSIAQRGQLQIAHLTIIANQVRCVPRAVPVRNSAKRDIINPCLSKKNAKFVQLATSALRAHLNMQRTCVQLDTNALKARRTTNNTHAHQALISPTKARMNA